MFKFKHIVLLAVFCLFSSALLGADKVAEQLVSNYEKLIENAKSTVISKLKARQDALTKAGKTDEAKGVEDIITKMQDRDKTNDEAVSNVGILDEKKTQNTGDVQIPKEAKKFGEHYYLLLEKGYCWKDAKDACEKLGGYILRVDSKKEADFIAKVFLLKNNVTQCWTDLRREGPNKYSFSNGEQSKFLEFADKEGNYMGSPYFLGSTGKLLICGHAESLITTVCEWDQQ